MKTRFGELQSMIDCAAACLQRELDAGAKVALDDVVAFVRRHDAILLQGLTPPEIEAVVQLTNDWQLLHEGLRGWLQIGTVVTAKDGQETPTDPDEQLRRMTCGHIDEYAPLDDMHLEDYVGLTPEEMSEVLRAHARWACVYAGR